MIKVNDKSYDNIPKKVSFGEYSVTQDDKKRVGKAPVISFDSDKMHLKIETIYDKKWLKELKINDKKDITKYISDVTYEEGKGWMSLTPGNCKCSIYRIDNDIFVIEFNCETEEGGKYYKISLNERVEMNCE